MTVPPLSHPPVPAPSPSASPAPLPAASAPPAAAPAPPAPIPPASVAPASVAPAPVAPAPIAPASVAPVPAACVPAVSVRPHRPEVTELRLSAFGPHRGAVFPFGPLTFIAGPSGSGKSTVLRVYEALARLGAGDELHEVFPDPSGCVPERVSADGQGRRGFRIGCTVDGPVGPVHLDLAVQAEPELRIVSERLTCEGQELLTTTLRDPRQRTVQAAWYTAGAVPVTRAPLPDDRLGTALLPLRVAGKTDGQLRVLAAAEQVLVALRSAYVCDPQPQRMRAPVAVGEGLLRRGCDNLAAVLRRTGSECAIRHTALVAAAREGCAGPVEDLTAEDLGDGTVRALLGRGARGATPLGRLGEGELKYLALSLVLLTGPRVLDMEYVAEVPDAHQALAVLADGFDRGLDRRQTRALGELAGRMCARGHIRLAGAVSDASCVREVAGVTVVDL